MKQIYDAVTDLIAKFTIESIVLEDIFFSKNISSAFAVGEVKGIVKLAAANADRPVTVYTPDPSQTGSCWLRKSHEIPDAEDDTSTA